MTGICEQVNMIYTSSNGRIGEKINGKSSSILLFVIVN